MHARTSNIHVYVELDDFNARAWETIRTSSKCKVSNATRSSLLGSGQLQLWTDKSGPYYSLLYSMLNRDRSMHGIEAMSSMLCQFLPPISCSGH